MDDFVAALRKYAQFKGRSHRREYWLFFGFYLLLSVLVGLIDGLFVTEDGTAVGWVGWVFGLAMLLPSIAVAVRRLHDTDRSGWWVLIGLVPVIGALVLVVMALQRGTDGPNRFGDDPLRADDPAFGHGSR